MSLSTGVRLGPYEIHSAIGAGGMGEVYKARDTRLDRTVALKVLPADLAADPDRRARFEREARAIAALSHPHICVVHDVGRHEDTDYLVMEFLDGETLAARLARAKGPLPLDQVLRVASEIADALDKAHRAGIVHRDLKPANIMLTKSGAKLLDFGLAKLRGPAVPISLSGMERATTAGGSGTATGTILGTMYYMAPEQVEGREADARSDLWALGVVIYEMATGARPFDGESAASVIGAILKDTPAPISTRRSVVPPALDHAVARCLARDPDDRWQSAADLRGTLRWIETGGESGSSSSTRGGVAKRPWLLLLSIASLIAFALGLIGGWRFFAPAPVAPPVVQFDVVPPIDAMLSPAPVAWAAQVALSADSKQVAFVALKRRGNPQIYVRSLDSRDAHALADTDDARFPFWSPDGQYVGFFAHGKLKKIAVAGGAAEEICEAPASRFATWNKDGVILMSLSPRGPVYRVSANGGQPSPATTIAPDQQVVSHSWPQFLPDGSHFLYYQRSLDPTKFQGVYVGELGSTFQSPRVLAINGMAVYFAGHLAFVRDGVLFAQQFDTKTLRTTGDPVRIADQVGYFSGSFGYSAIAGSETGALAFGPSVGMTTSLVWVTRGGAPAGHLVAPDVYSSPRISFDQKSVAVATAGRTMAERDIWIIDVTRNDAQRATTDPAADWFPTWSPDGLRIFFASSRLGITTVFQKAGAGQDGLFGKPTAVASYPFDVSSDGTMLACQLSTETGYDIGVEPIDKPEQPTVLPWVTSFNEVQPRFAPNTRFLAYASDESGRFEVYVRPYPSDNRRWKVSLAGGMQPEWGRDGKELFYISADKKMMAVPVSTDGTFQAGTPNALFDVDIPPATEPYPTDYAVTADGRRFLVNTVVDQPTRPALTVILNWTASLKK